MFTASVSPIETHLLSGTSNQHGPSENLPRQPSSSRTANSANASRSQSPESYRHVSRVPHTFEEDAKNVNSNRRSSFNNQQQRRSPATSIHTPLRVSSRGTQPSVSSSIYSQLRTNPSQNSVSRHNDGGELVGFLDESTFYPRDTSQFSISFV